MVLIWCNQTQRKDIGSTNIGSLQKGGHNDGLASKTDSFEGVHRVKVFIIVVLDEVMYHDIYDRTDMT